ncbi:MULTISPECIES: hypothetical protein [Cyanophyceae]|uniref:hypothetical protein n=1 Tax=Cyanophyceae TaxID=3028117 RepID=UPI001688211D|nr:hypothetical protein [Trichocoleus sp. FACHB-69]MBD1931535.1 hypothetical protein [Trichocoleus sp. FACHB-69]
MRKVLIVVDAEVDETGAIIAASPTTAQMVSALKANSLTIGATAQTKPAFAGLQNQAEALVVSTQWLIINKQLTSDNKLIWCPLTLNLPENLDFPAQSVYNACRDVTGLRQLVEQLGYATGVGNFWLAVVLTAKGPLYSEVIGKDEVSEGLKYRMPVHLSDSQRQPLYQLGYKLLQYLSAPPSVYLLQFGFSDQNLVFDRLLPFPAPSAIASIGIQKPDLFVCHWHCLTGQPIYDLEIIPTKL